VFKEIFTGKTLVHNGGTWSFTGAAIPFPTVFEFKQSTVSPDLSAAFNQALSQLLTQLETCWTTTGASPDIGAMFALRSSGQELIQKGIRPEFLRAAPSPSEPPTHRSLYSAG
jgi:hypothetical protein